jgi:hypothetical protein
MASDKTASEVHPDPGPPRSEADAWLSENADDAKAMNDLVGPGFEDYDPTADPESSGKKPGQKKEDASDLPAGFNYGELPDPKEGGI